MTTTTDAECETTVANASPNITTNGTHSPETPDNSLETITHLQKELSDMTLKHKEEMYWLRLELLTARKEKEAVEDRMAELYRDMQDLHNDSAKQRGSPRRPLALDADYVAGLHGQVDKFERLLRIMNNQIALVRSASDAVAQSLKEEISDLMDEKCQTEMELMNKCAELEKENKKTNLQLEQALTHQHQLQDAKSIPSGKSQEQETRAAPIGSIETNMEKQKLQAEVERLRKGLAREKRNTLECQAKSRLERASLIDQVDKLQKDMLVLQSAAEAAQRLDQEETVQTLDRVSMLWDRADESISNLESVIMELRPSPPAQQQEQQQQQWESVNPAVDGQERLLSTLETASLVHGQVKVSLMLIELKLQNNLACLKSDHVGESSNPENGTPQESTLSIDDRIKEIRDEAMAAIQQIESVLDEQIQKLDSQSAEEANVVKVTLASKVKDLDQLQSRQEQLEAEVTKLKDNEANGHSPESKDEMSDLFVSREVMERLQNEVLQIVERVKEKNETIGRLTATVEEHKVRERSLMEELKRHMKEQGERQLQEQRRILADNATREMLHGSDSEYEEQTVEVEAEVVVVEDASEE